MSNKAIKEGWVVVTDTYLAGPQILHKIIEADSDDYNPEVYETELAAWVAIAEDMRETLTSFINGEQELDCTRFGPDGFPAYYEEYADGTICVHNENGDLLIDTTISEWRANV